MNRRQLLDVLQRIEEYLNSLNLCEQTGVYSPPRGERSTKGGIARSAVEEEKAYPPKFLDDSPHHRAMKWIQYKLENKQTFSREERRRHFPGDDTLILFDEWLEREHEKACRMHGNKLEDSKNEGLWFTMDAADRLDGPFEDKIEAQMKAKHHAYTKIGLPSATYVVQAKQGVTQRPWNSEDKVQNFAKPVNLSSCTSWDRLMKFPSRKDTRLFHV